MAFTPGGLPYPTGTDYVVNGDEAIKALAEALDPKVTVTAGVITPTAGTTIGYRLHKVGRLVVLDGSFSRAADFTANILLATLPVGFRPIIQINGGLHLGASFGAIASWSSILPNGEIHGNNPGAAGVRQVGFNIPFMLDA